MQSKQLTEFYQAYAKWLDDGAPDGKPFDRITGLCHGITLFVAWDYGQGNPLKYEMKIQFEKAELDGSTPFNGDENLYADESNASTMHLNPERVLWVRSHVNG